MTRLYAILADVVLAVHVAVVWFVILGLALTLLGGGLGWRWIRNPWFRLAHLGTMIVVVLQSWIQQICFLTTWEIWLREAAGQELVGDSAVSRLLSRFIWIDAPTWVFVVAYTLFAAAVAAAFIFVPPRWRGRGSDRTGQTDQADPCPTLHRGREVH